MVRGLGIRSMERVLVRSILTMRCPLWDGLSFYMKYACIQSDQSFPFRKRNRGNSRLDRKKWSLPGRPRQPPFLSLCVLLLHSLMRYDKVQPVVWGKQTYINLRLDFLEFYSGERGWEGEGAWKALARSNAHGRLAIERSQKEIEETISRRVSILRKLPTYLIKRKE